MKGEVVIITSLGVVFILFGVYLHEERVPDPPEMLIDPSEVPEKYSEATYQRHLQEYKQKMDEWEEEADAVEEQYRLAYYLQWIGVIGITIGFLWGFIVLHDRVHQMKMERSTTKSP